MSTAGDDWTTVALARHAAEVMPQTYLLDWLRDGAPEDGRAEVVEQARRVRDAGMAGLSEEDARLGHTFGAASRALWTAVKRDASTCMPLPRV